MLSFKKVGECDTLSGGYHIKFRKEYAIKGFTTLVNSGGQFGCLRDNEYVVSQELISLLQTNKVSYDLLEK